MSYGFHIGATLSVYVSYHQWVINGIFLVNYYANNVILCICHNAVCFCIYVPCLSHVFGASWLTVGCISHRCADQRYMSPCQLSVLFWYYWCYKFVIVSWRFNYVSLQSAIDFIEAIPLCVNTISIYIFTSYTTINIVIHTIKCYKFNGYMFQSPLRPSSDQLLQMYYNVLTIWDPIMCT